MAWGQNRGQAGNLGRMAGQTDRDAPEEGPGEPMSRAPRADGRKDKWSHPGRESRGQTDMWTHLGGRADKQNWFGG